MKKLSQLAFTLIMIISLSLITGANTASAQSGDTDTSGSNGNSCVTLDNNMRYRMRDISVNNEVSDLQDYLIAEGYMTGNTTGFFGVATLKAVKSFQSANGLLSSGYVGPVTRAKIKSLSCDTANHNDGNTMYPTDPLVATKPVGCTREYRSCPDGSTMYRDANCGWHAEMCKGESVYKRLPSITNVIISDNDTMTIYGNNLDLARNINLAGSANPNIDISTSFSGAIITSSYIKLENIRAKLEKYIVYTENGYNMTITINNDTQGTTSNTFQFYVPAMKNTLKTNPAISSAYFDMNNTALTFTGSGFNVNDGEYYIDYKYDCPSASLGCSGKLSNMSYTGQNKLTFNLDSNILNNTKGYISFRLNDKNGNAISQLYTLPYYNQLPSKKISISSATLKEFDANQVNLMIYGTGFKNGSSININGCSAGNVASLSGNSDTETSVGFDKTYLLGCVTPGTYTNVYIAGNGTDNSNTYSVYVPMMSVKPTVTSTFTNNNSGVANGVSNTYQYSVGNYRSGLVMDVEVKVNCDVSYTTTYKIDCSKYLFNLSGKAAESYYGVMANPFVKGGASYRFTGADGQINISGFVDPSYVANYPYTTPVPSSIEYSFVLRDINNGGATVSSETKVYNFKG